MAYRYFAIWDIVCKLHVQQYSSYMVTVSFIVGGNRRKSCWPAVISIIYNVIYIKHTSPWTGIKLTTLVVKCTDCVFGKCKFNYCVNMVMASCHLASFIIVQLLIYFIVQYFYIYDRLRSASWLKSASTPQIDIHWRIISNQGLI